MVKRGKAQGMPINVIIIAAIGLAVLVILFLLITGNFKRFSSGVKETGLTCRESCKLSNYVGGVKSVKECASNNYPLGGSISDVDTQKNEVCCCTKELYVQSP